MTFKILLIGGFASLLMGCAVSGEVQSCDSSTEMPGVSMQRANPRAVEDVGLVYVPVSAGNTALSEWASHRAEVYGAEVRYIYSTRSFYHAVLRRGSDWLLTWEVRGNNLDGVGFPQSMSFTLLRPSSDLIEDLHPPEGIAVIDPDRDVVMRFENYTPWIGGRGNVDPHDWECEVYITDDPNNEGQYWGHFPPLVIHDEDLDGKPAMVVWTTGNRRDLSDVESVYWLTPE